MSTMETVISSVLLTSLPKRSIIMSTRKAESFLQQIPDSATPLHTVITNLLI